MNNNKHNKIDNQIVRLEKMIGGSRGISKKMRAELYHTLEETSDSIGKLRVISKSFNDVAQSQISERLGAMEDKIIYLYGKINDLFVASELTKIIDESRELEQTLMHGNLTPIIKKFQFLDSHIADLRRNFCLSKVERLELSRAEEVLKRADAYLNGRQIQDVKTPVLIPFDGDEIDELVMELWETADLLHHNKTKEGMSHYRRLPESVKTIFKKHEKAAPGRTEELRTIQALIATSYELANGEDWTSGYLSAKEIDKLFAELDSIRAG